MRLLTRKRQAAARLPRRVRPMCVLWRPVFSSIRRHDACPPLPSSCSLLAFAESGRVVAPILYGRNDFRHARMQISTLAAEVTPAPPLSDAKYTDAPSL